MTINTTKYEFHDLPTTKTRKACWVEVYHGEWRTNLYTRKPYFSKGYCRLWSTSVATDWDLPMEYESQDTKETGLGYEIQIPDSVIFKDQVGKVVAVSRKAITVNFNGRIGIYSIL